MDQLNTFQREFLETLAVIQKNCVQIALSQHDDGALKERYDDLTSEVIIRIMELIDGYYAPNIGRLTVICEKTGERLKGDPFIELHDAVCAYLDGAD